MAKPEKYDGKDAVKLVCLRDYLVKDGTDDPVTFKKGEEYLVSPRSAAHLLRQRYNGVKRTEDGRRVPLGDAPFFSDPKADAQQAKADKAAAVRSNDDSRSAAEGAAAGAKK